MNLVLSRLVEAMRSGEAIVSVTIALTLLKAKTTSNELYIYFAS